MTFTLAAGIGRIWTTRDRGLKHFEIAHRKSISGVIPMIRIQRTTAGLFIDRHATKPASVPRADHQLQCDLVRTAIWRELDGLAYRERTARLAPGTGKTHRSLAAQTR